MFLHFSFRFFVFVYYNNLAVHHCSRCIYDWHCLGVVEGVFIVSCSCHLQNDCDCASDCSCTCSICTRHKDQSQNQAPHLERALDGKCACACACAGACACACVRVRVCVYEFVSGCVSVRCQCFSISNTMSIAINVLYYKHIIYLSDDNE